MKRCYDAESDEVYLRVAPDELVNIQEQAWNEGFTAGEEYSVGTPGWGGPESNPYRRADE
jgi:hypothetical protein